MHYGLQHYMKLLFMIHVRFIALLFLSTYIFLDILFTQSGTDYLLPTPVVIKNYKTDTDATPNRNGSF